MYSQAHLSYSNPFSCTAQLLNFTITFLIKLPSFFYVAHLNICWVKYSKCNLCLYLENCQTVAGWCQRCCCYVEEGFPCLPAPPLPHILTAGTPPHLERQMKTKELWRNIMPNEQPTFKCQQRYWKIYCLIEILHDICVQILKTTWTMHTCSGTAIVLA